MKNFLSFTLLVLAMFVANCAAPASRNGEKPVRYAGYVDAAIFDPTPRPPTTHLEILRSYELPPDSRIIARFTLEGTPDKEGKILNAIAWRARQIGADGLLPARPPAGSGTSVNVQVGTFYSRVRGEHVFAADAFIYTSRVQRPGQ